MFIRLGLSKNIVELEPVVVPQWRENEDKIDD